MILKEYKNRLVSLLELGGEEDLLFQASIVGTRLCVVTAHML